MNSKKIVVFDLDRTLIDCDLPIEVIKKYYERKQMSGLVVKLIGCFFRLIPYHKIRRGFEYFELEWISDVEKKKIIDEVCDKNSFEKMCNLLKIYIQNGFEAIIVTAGPEKHLAALSNKWNVKIIGSTLKFGFITRDLQGRKEIIYEELRKKGFQIIAIYSDQRSDLSALSNENFLVDRSGNARRVEV